MKRFLTLFGIMLLSTLGYSQNVGISDNTAFNPSFMLHLQPSATYANDLFSVQNNSGTYYFHVKLNGQHLFNFTNTTPLFSTDLMELQGDATFPDVLNAYTSIANATAVYGQSSAAGGTGIWGSATNDANSWGVYGSSATGIGVIGMTNNTAGIGVYGTNNSATGFGGSFRNTNATGTGLVASGNNLVPSYIVSGTGAAFTGDPYGIAVFKNGARTNFEGAGYFMHATTGVGANTGVAVAYRWSGTNYKIINIGSFGGLVSTDVWGLTNDTNDRKIMFCPESPEILFQDYGQGKLVNGKANVIIDPIFSKNIVVNSEHPLRVFIQLEGDCNGVYVTNKTENGFSVIELMNGISNVTFSWFITANRKDYINPVTGEIISKNEGVRFPQAPNAERVLILDKRLNQKNEKIY